MRTIAFVSDTHIFGRYGLNLPHFLTPENLDLVPGTEALKIYNYWQYFCGKCDEFGVDTVWFLGDLLHGQNPIERGTLLLSANMDEQEDAAVQLLTPLVKGRTIYGLGGSGYHVSTKGHSTEKDVFDRLLKEGARDGRWYGKICNMHFMPSKKIFNLAHGESAAYIYREMLLGREGVALREAQAMGKIPKINVFVRGHWHNFIYIHEKGMHMIQLPGWMAFEPSKPYLKSYGKMQGDIGGVIVFIDDDDRIKVWHFILEEPIHICDATQEG